MVMVQIESGAHGDSVLTPTRADKFSFGLWTVGNPGRDQFGQATRPQLDPNEMVRRLSQLGAFGVSMHDDDLVPPDASLAKRDQIVGSFKSALDETGMGGSVGPTT